MSHTQPNPGSALAPRTVLCLRSGSQRPGASESGRSPKGAVESFARLVRNN